MSRLVNYYRKNRCQAFILLISILLVYGKQAFSTNFYVDAEVIINNPGTVYNWNEIGRFGLIAIKYLIGGNWYNPYFEGILFLITYWLLAMVSACFISKNLRKDNIIFSTVFALLALVYPTYADQFMFRFQSFEIAFAMLLILIAGNLFMDYLDNGNKNLAISIVALEVLAFGIYQSMVNLILTCFIITYLFSINYLGKKERLSLIKKSIVLFLIGFVIYEFIVNLFFNSGDYLSSQTGWLSNDVIFTIRNMLAYAKRVLLSMDRFYPITYSICVIVAIIYILFAIIKKEKNTGVKIFGIIGVLASPFLLCIMTGTPTVYRAQCMLPFANAALVIYFADSFRNLIKNEKALNLVFAVVFISLILVQTSVIERMFYTQDVIREADRLTAVELMERINLLEPKDDIPVIFLGHLEPKINGACYNKVQVQSFLAYSLFGFAYVDGVPIEDAEYYNTYRILGYLDTLGFHYKYPDKELVNEAIKENSSNSYWTSSDSVYATYRYILVNLSE